jgi:metal-responsive CopG/Arc/MetJ family transcriptional regulator
VTTLTVESGVEQTPHMVTIQVVLEAALLKAADRTARRLKLNRSAFIREAVRSHIQALQVRAREDADREGYERLSETTADLAAWDRVAEWPKD